MPTLKRKNADGQWEYIQVSGLDVSQLKTNVDTVTSSLAAKANQSALDTTNTNVAANTTALVDSATDLTLTGTKLQLKKADGTKKGTGIDIPTVGLDDTTTSTSKTWSSSKINTTLSTINASPKGVYATLSALQTAFPTGNTNIYLVTADGKWYYWSGSAWTAGGVYQGTTWQEGIDARTNSLGMVYPNLKARIDDLAGAIQNSVSIIPTFTDIVDGTIDDITGQDATNGRKKRTSGLHSILSGRILTITVPTTYYMTIYAYNSNNVADFAAKVVDSKQGTITYTTAYNYYRFSFVRADSAFFADNTFINEITFTLDFTNSEIKTARGAFPSLSDRFNSLSAENTLSNAFKYGLQLFTSSMNVAGTWINPSGAFVANASYKYAKIPVVAGETVSITRNDNGVKSFFASNTGAIAFIDTNGNILSSVSPENYFNGAYNNSSIVTVTIPTNTAYLGLTTVLGATWDITSTLIVVYGDTISSTLLASGEIGKLYNYPLKDTTARALIKNLPALSTSGKKWVYVGDSITENNSYATSHYWSYIQTDLGFTGINMGASGTGYKRSEDTNVAFYQRIGSIDITADVVTIFGSINDAYYGTYGTLGTANDVFTTGQDNTVCACINKTLDTLYSVMPLVKVGLITPLPNFNAYPGLTSIWFENYVNAIVQIGKQRGIPVLDLYHRSLLKPWDATHNSLFYENDNTKNTHPNANGHKMFYPAIREFLKSLI
jgi:lysophospholipase L1-like esterase